MDLAYVNKLAKDNSGVMYLLVREELFYRTVYVKGMKTKALKERVFAILAMITNKKRPKEFDSTREQSVLECFKNYATLNEYTSNPQWVRPSITNRQKPP